MRVEARLVANLANLIDTILSNPAEWWSLYLGLAVAAIVIVVTDDRVEAVLGTVIVLLVALSLVPVRVTAEWHYWGGAVAVMLLLGIYELGPADMW